MIWSCTTFDVRDNYTLATVFKLEAVNTVKRFSNFGFPHVIAPAFSTPAFSTPAIYSPFFPLLHFPLPHFQRPRFDHWRPVLYAGRWRRWDDEQSPFTVVDIDLWALTTLAVESPTDLFVASHWLHGTIFLSIYSHFARIQSSRSQHVTSTNQLSCGFYHNVYGRLVSKCLHVPQTSFVWFHGTRRGY